MEKENVEVSIRYQALIATPNKQVSSLRYLIVEEVRDDSVVPAGEVIEGRSLTFQIEHQGGFLFQNIILIDKRHLVSGLVDEEVIEGTNLGKFHSISDRECT